MDTIFINSENSRSSDPHRLLFNLSHQLNVRRSDKYTGLSNVNVR